MGATSHGGSGQLSRRPGTHGRSSEDRGGAFDAASALEALQRRESAYEAEEAGVIRVDRVECKADALDGSLARGGHVSHVWKAPQVELGQIELRLARLQREQPLKDLRARPLNEVALMAATRGGTGARTAAAERRHAGHEGAPHRARPTSLGAPRLAPRKTSPKHCWRPIKQHRKT